MQIRHYLSALGAAGCFLLHGGSANAQVILSESFETPQVTGFDDNTVPASGWIGSTEGFGATNRGLFNGTVLFPATSPFTTPLGEQGYKLNYSNSTLTTAVGVIGGLQADVEYQVVFNAAIEGGQSGSYWVQLVAFDAADDNTARREGRGGRPGRVLAETIGPVTGSDMSTVGSLTFTTDGSDPDLGKEIGRAHV